MSTRPTAREVWRRLVDEAGEEQIAAILSLTQEQVDAELAAVPGFDAKAEDAAAERFLEELASGAIEERMGLSAPREQPTSAVVAIAQPASPARVERRRRPRTTMVLLFAAIAAAAGTAAYVTLRPHAPSPSPPPEPEPSPSPWPSPSFNPQPDLVAAADWRSKAIAACDATQWEQCLADLDIARALDPDGDDAPLVRSTRQRAIAGVLGKSPKRDKPPVP